MPTPIYNPNSFQPLTGASHDTFGDADVAVQTAPTVDFGTAMTGGVRRRQRLSGEGFSFGRTEAERELSDIAKYMRRLNVQVEAALSGEDDPLARDGAIREGLPYWGLAYEKRNYLKAPQREFLNHLLTCLTSVRAAQDAVALSMLHGVISQFVLNLRGTTEKDVVSWIVRLREAGFNLSEPLTAEFPTAEHAESADEFHRQESETTDE